MDLKTYSEFATLLLNDYYDEFKISDNFYGVKAGVIETTYGKTISISFIFKKPFGEKDSDMIHDNVKKPEIKQLLISILPNIGSFDIAISTCTKEVWEKNYKPLYSQN